MTHILHEENLCSSCRRPFITKDLSSGRSLPHLLPCCHIICTSCRDQVKSPIVSCQTCKVQCFDKSSLPIHHYLIGKIIAARRSHSESTEKLDDHKVEFDRPSSWCSSGLSTTSGEDPTKECDECQTEPAELICQNCDASPFCKQCFDKCHDSKVMKRHKAISIGARTVRCEEHKKPLEYYCDDDKTEICSDCAAVGIHRLHNISKIDTVDPHSLRTLIETAKERALHLRKLREDMKDEHSSRRDMEKKLHLHFNLLFAKMQIKFSNVKEQLHQTSFDSPTPVNEMMVALNMHLRDLKSAIETAKSDVIYDRPRRSSESTMKKLLEDSEKFSFKSVISKNCLKIDDRIFEQMENHITFSIGKAEPEQEKRSKSAIHECVQVEPEERDEDKIKSYRMTPPSLAHVPIEVNDDAKKRFQSALQFDMKDEAKNPCQVPPQCDVENEVKKRFQTPPQNKDEVKKSFQSITRFDHGKKCPPLASPKQSSGDFAKQNVVVQRARMASKDDSEESDFSPPSGRQSAAFKPPSPITKGVIPPPSQKNLSENLVKLQRLRSSSRMGEPRVPVEPFKVRISHVISPKVFYIQRSDRLEELEKFREKIQTAATSASALPDPSDGMLVLAKFTDDEAWYRARVKTIDNCKTVFYIDYGNTEVLESNDCKVLSDHLKDVEPFCEVCSLCDAEPANGEEWSEEACNHFNALVCRDYDLFATDVIRSNGLLSVRLEVPPSSAIRNDSLVCISNALRFLGFASGNARVNEGLANRELDIARFTTQKYYFVHISHAINVNSFYVQFLHEGMSPDGSATPFQKDLQDFYTEVTKTNDQSILTVGPLRVGMLVVAPYSDDSCFYRARITSLQGCHAEVFYLDYGNSGKIHVMNVHKLVDRFLELPQMAVRCTLELDGNINHPLVVNAFGEFMAKNDIVKMKVLEVLSDQLVVVRLFSADEGNQPSIGEHFIKLLKSVRSPSPVGSQSSRKEVAAVSPKLTSPLPPLRSTPKPKSGPDAHIQCAKARGFEPVVVTHYVNPSEIYIRPTERDATWTVFNTDFDMTMKRKSPENRVKVLKEGDYLAYLKKSSWYRVRILKIEDNLCDINYIDIGKTERVSVYDEFAKLPPETFKTKGYCLRTHLHGLIPAGDKGWSITATEKLGQNVKGIKLFIKLEDKFVVAENDEKTVPITMLAYERRASHPLKPMEDVWTDLGKKLVKEGLALKIILSASPPSNIMGVNKLFTENGSQISEVGSYSAA